MLLKLFSGFFKQMVTLVCLVISSHQRETTNNQIPLFPQQTTIMTDPYGEFEDSDEMEVRGRAGKGMEEKDSSKVFQKAP